jgi:predicted TPR repeat methyltransferase
MSLPILNPALLISPVENGYVAYDPATDHLHELNPLAALIAELCDGKRTIEQIHELVDPLLPEGQTVEIDRWIEQAAKSGVVTFGSSLADGQRQLSADELAKLAFRLSEHGKTRAAYLCQKRAAELEPNQSRRWYDLAELAFQLGRRDEARADYERYLELKPDDAEIQHLLVALRDEPPPPRVPDVAIQQMYQAFAPTFESNLIGELKYRGPEGVQQVIDAVMGDRRQLAILDVGCGSGLAGVRFKPLAASLVGIDLSPEMLALARAREIYDRLEVAEITAWLARSNETFDLIISCDCLIYIGDLRLVIEPAARLLRPGGILAFSLERSDRHPFHLTDSGRYAHHADYIREVAAAAKLNVGRIEEGFLRMEYGVEVGGLYVALTKD